MEEAIGNSTAKFSIRQNKVTAVAFERGQEVIAYDDAVSESVVVSGTENAGPWGLSFPYEEGYAEASWTKETRPTGTLEAVLNWRDFEDDPYHTAGSAVVKLWRITDAFHLVGLNLQYHGSPAKWIVRANVETYELGVGVNADNIYGTTEIVEDRSYRVSLTWAYNGSTTTFELFVDGVSNGTATIAGTPDNQTSNPDYLSLYADTQHDVHVADVRLWDDVRTAAEIVEKMFSRLTGAEDGLALCWNVDEGAGTSLEDRGPENRDGTLYAESGHYPAWTRSFHDWTGLFADGVAWSTSTVDWRHFAGSIKSVTRSTIEPDLVSDEITCVDYGAALARRQATRTLERVSARYAASKLMQKHATDEGIGYGAVEPGGTVLSQTFESVALSRALDDLEDATGRRWWVDFQKELRFEEPGLVAAAFDIADSDSPAKFLVNSARRTRSKDQYANRLIARIKVVEAGVEKGYRLVVEDAGEIAARKAAEGGSGIYERHEDLPRVQSLEQGVELLVGRLYRAVQYAETITYRTDLPGLRAGARQAIQISELGADDFYVIDSISKSLEGGRIRYRISATTARTSLSATKALAATLDEKTNFAPAEATVVIAAMEVLPADGVDCGDAAVVTGGTPETRIGYLIIGEGEIG